MLPNKCLVAWTYFPIISRKYGAGNVLLSTVEVEGISVGQLALKLKAVKVGGWSYRPGIEPGPHAHSARWAARQDFFQISNFDSL